MIDVLSLTAGAALLVCAVVDLSQRRYLRATLLTAGAGLNLLFVAS